LEAMSIGYRVFAGEELTPLDGDHPVYEEIKKDIGVRDEKSF